MFVNFHILLKYFILLLFLYCTEQVNKNLNLFYCRNKFLKDFLMEKC